VVRLQTLKSDSDPDVFRERQIGLIKCSMVISEGLDWRMPDEGEALWSGWTSVPMTDSTGSDS
jgi:hypothetical protein